MLQHKPVRSCITTFSAQLSKLHQQACSHRTNTAAVPTCQVYNPQTAGMQIEEKAALLREGTWFTVCADDWANTLAARCLELVQVTQDTQQAEVTMWLKASVCALWSREMTCVADGVTDAAMCQCWRLCIKKLLSGYASGPVSSVL